MNFLEHLVTGKDNTTHDGWRWSFVLTTGAILAGFVYNGFEHGTFDLLNFAQAVGLNAGAHGGAVAVKQFSGAEPEPDEDK